MDVIYLAAPLTAPTREGIEKNRERAARWAAWALRQGFSPVCSWITLTGVIAETPEERKRGLESDCAQVERCDGLWYVGGRISGGMAIEGTHGLAHGVPAVDLTYLGEEPPGFICAEEFAGILSKARIAPLVRFPTRESAGHTWVRAQTASANYFEKLKEIGRRDQFDRADCFTPYEPPP